MLIRFRKTSVHRSSTPFKHLLCLVALLLFSLTATNHAAQSQQSSSGMVVSGHRQATEAGQKILAQGGNAIDAAVAVATTLNVAEAWGSGIGGKVVMLYFDATRKQVYCVEALDQASQAMPEKHAGKRTDAQSIGVPGLLIGWAKAHEKWGTKPWATLLEPAIQTAENGYTLDQFDIIALKNAQEKLTEGGGSDIYLPNQQIPKAGAIQNNPQLAQTFRIIQQQGYRALYGGELGKKMVEHINKVGGWMTMDDLKNYKPRIYPAPQTRYRSCQVYSSDGPATGGATVLLSLACLNQQQPARDPNGIERMDQMARVLMQVYGVVRNKLADQPASGATLRRELTPMAVTKLNRQAMQMNLQTSQRQPLPGIDPEELAHSTTHFVVSDQMGNIVCATQSLGKHYGTGIMIPGTGILMNTSLNNFSTTSTSPNASMPGRRPRSTMSPTIVLQAAKPVLALGSPGGQRIPVSVLQVLTDVIDYDISLEQAIQMPRFHVRNSTRMQLIELEHTMTPNRVNDLTSLGWQSQQVTSNLMYFGPVNAIGFNGLTSIGVADERRSNVASGVELSEQ
jgi:gamma-glutamyltranspeptidase/glutathione hydrolase